VVCVFSPSTAPITVIRSTSLTSDRSDISLLDDPHTEVQRVAETVIANDPGDRDDLHEFIKASRPTWRPPWPTRGRRTRRRNRSSRSIGPSQSWPGPGTAES
jgi:hypothetical protein